MKGAHPTGHLPSLLFLSASGKTGSLSPFPLPECRQLSWCILSCTKSITTTTNGIHGLQKGIKGKKYLLQVFPILSISVLCAIGGYCLEMYLNKNEKRK